MVMPSCGMAKGLGLVHFDKWGVLLSLVTQIPLTQILTLPTLEILCVSEFDISIIFVQFFVSFFSWLY